MKISSASKKVLASALSAAMVVAFAPTVAFGAQGDVTLTNTNASTGAATTAQYSTIADAVKAAKKGDTITLNADLAESFAVPAGAELTLDLNGHTLTATDADANGTADVDYVVAVQGATAAGDKVMASVGTAPSAAAVDSCYVRSLDQAQTATKKIAEADGTEDTIEADGVIYEKSTSVNTFQGTTLYKISTSKGSAAGKLTVKGDGAIDGESGLLGVNEAVQAAAGTTVTLKGGTVKGMVSSASGINGKAGTVVVDGGTVAATSEGRVDAVRAEKVTVKAGKVSATSTKASAAYAVVANEATVSGGEVTATGNESSTGIYDEDDAYSTIKAGTVTATYNGTVANAKANALVGNVKVNGGTVNGLFGAATQITGGKFSEDLSSNTTNVQSGYKAYDDGKVSTVYVQSIPAANFDVAQAIKGAGISAVPTAITDGVADALEVAANPQPKGTSKVTYAEGWDASKFAAVLADGTQSVALKVKGEFAKIDPKTTNLTDEQKAVVKDITAKAYELDSAVDAIYTQSLVITYKDPSVTNSKTVTVATITDLGSVKTGRDTNARELRLNDENGNAIASNLTVMSADGAKLAAKAVNGSTNYYSSAVSTFATIHTDAAIIKEKLEKKDDAEKATQGIDVAKKSKTVKLAKKATKTKKAQSFSMGVSAETAVTTAKKSGSKYVTVKGGKVTLKKGVKKGTYTAKVSIKAAASDQYLAAAKTVTVKFTVKK